MPFQLFILTRHLHDARLRAADARRRERFWKTGKGQRYLTNRLKESFHVIRASKLERH